MDDPLSIKPKKTLRDAIKGCGIWALIGWQTPPAGQFLYVEGDGQSSVLTEAPPRHDGHCRIVVISDTHEQHRLLRIPPGDVLCHVGDVFLWGSADSDGYALQKLRDFNDWLGRMPHPHKVVVAGNHDVFLEKMGKANVQRELTNARYLENETWDGPGGLRVWGSPISRANSATSPNKAFQALDEQALVDAIPADVNCLMVHGHPLTMPALHGVLQSRRIPLCLFGHDHFAHGAHKFSHTLGINAAILGKRFQPVQLPVVYDARLKSEV